MLSKILIRRTIQLKSRIPFVMAEMAQCNIQNFKNLDNRIDPMSYAEAKLLAYMNDKNSPDLSGLKEIEKIEFQRSKELLKKFQDMDNFCNYAYEVYRLVNRLYISLSIDISQSNFMAFNQTTDEQFAQYLDEAMQEYQKLLDSVKGNEEWTKKLETEVGSYWSQIHSLHVHNPKMEKILANHDFDKEYFFK